MKGCGPERTVVALQIDQIRCHLTEDCVMRCVITDGLLSKFLLFLTGLRTQDDKHYGLFHYTNELSYPQQLAILDLYSQTVLSLTVRAYTIKLEYKITIFLHSHVIYI